MKKVYFVSGHLDITTEEFEQHYVPRLDAAVKEGASFVVGDAKGVDFIAQHHLALCDRVTVYHMFTEPRVNAASFPTVGGFKNDTERDAAMTAASTTDIAWVRPGREKSGTAKNLARRSPGKITFNPKLIEVTRFPVDFVLDLFREYDPKERWSVQVGEQTWATKLDSQRYQLFKVSTECVVCGLKGTHFRLDTYKDMYPSCHFNLYAERDGQPILFTKDHIQPKSKGGANSVKNYQVMCLPCNMQKANREISLEDLRAEIVS